MEIARQVSISKFLFSFLRMEIARQVSISKFLFSFLRMEIARLQRTIELKSKEMNRVRKLAKNILDQVRQKKLFEILLFTI